MTARQLNRATLQRQLLLERERLDVVQAVRRVVALQAQEPASPYIALWSRLLDFDPAELDAAFADHSIVKATLLRITLHAVTSDDYPRFHEAMQVTLRAARLNDRRFRSEGLMPADADALLPDALAFAAQKRTNADVERWLEERFGAPKPYAWWALRQYGPFVHAPTGGAWSFGPRPSYCAAPVVERPGDPARSSQWLVRRYLEGFGPASVQDVAQFATIYRPPMRDAVAALLASGELVPVEGPGNTQLVDLASAAVPDEEAPAPPRLLPMWDSLLLAYADRSRVIPAEYRKAVARSNGDTLPAILVDGYVVGVWRPVEDGIEVTAFETLTHEAWAGLESEARSLLRLLRDREPVVYRRYGRWWDKLPRREARVLRW